MDGLAKLVYDHTIVSPAITLDAVGLSVVAQLPDGIVAAPNVVEPEATMADALPIFVGEAPPLHN